MSSEPQKKRKKYSKNKKRNWNKTDIADVEEFLEEKRIQERTGGLVEEKEDDQLFFVDKVTSLDDEPASKRKKRESKPLKCHSNLEPAPHIKPIFIDKNKRNPNREKNTSNRVLEKQKQGFVSKTELLAQKQRKEAILKKREQARASKNRKRLQASYDLWEDGQEETVAPDKKKKINIPKSLKEKPSCIPAIEPAHPGQSYNPTFEDHQDLLLTATEIEAKKVKDEERVTRATDDFYKKAVGTSEERWNTEMSVGLFNEDSDISENESDNDPDSLSINPPVNRDNKKSERQRRKEKRQKLKEMKLKKLKENKLIKNEIFRLKSIKKQVNEKEKLIQEKGQRKLELQEKNKGATKKLGKLKFEAEEIPLKLSEELEGSLRLLKPEGNLLEDRFKSFQKRNIIEPRKRAKHERKYKPKTFEKKGHKAVVL